MTNNINYIIPNYMALGRNNILIDILSNYKYILNNNINLYSIYGTFPNCIFNGGRPEFLYKEVSVKEMKQIKEYYNKHNIRITLTFTNMLITDKHLGDEYSNSILEVFHDGYNEVLVASPILEEYIRNTYPKYKINKSITSNIGKSNIEEEYNLFVIDKKYNRDYEYLKNIHNKEQIEILCDEVCRNDCPFTTKHYLEISKKQLGIIENAPYFGECRYNSKNTNYDFLMKRNKESKYYISPSDIQNIYYPIGYRYYKLSGRDKYNMYSIYSIITHFIKNKYQSSVLTKILERMILEQGKDISLNYDYIPNYTNIIDSENWSYL